MRRLISYLTLVLLITAALPLFAQDWKTYQNDEYGFRMEYPSTWNFEIVSDQMLTVTNLDAEMPVVIGVMAEKARESDSESGLRDMMSDIVEDIQSQFGDSDLFELEFTDDGTVDLHGLPAYKLSLDVSLLGTEFLHMENFILQQGDDVVILSFSADAQDWQKQEIVFSRVRESFSFNGRPD